MENIRETIGKNLTNLRKQQGLTQGEIAEKFNYSDKAISKWENGDTLPDIEVLLKLCDFYGVTIEYLLHENNQEQYVKKAEYVLKNKIIIAALMIVLVWMICTITFVFSYLRGESQSWVSLVWAVPASALVTFIVNRVLFRKKIVYIICLSILTWTLIAAIYLTIFQFDLWPIFFLGIPIQISLILWANMKSYRKNN